MTREVRPAGAAAMRGVRRARGAAGLLITPVTPVAFVCVPATFAPGSSSFPATEHAEGPCWDPRTGQLLWVDQFDGLVHLADYEPGPGLLRLARPEAANSGRVRMDDGKSDPGGRFWAGSMARGKSAGAGSDAGIRGTVTDCFRLPEKRGALVM